MTLYDWIKLYYKKTGEYPNGWPGTDFVFEDDCGFCVYIQDDATLIIGEVCGDGRYWVSYLIDKAKELGCDKLRFWTKRNPAAFTRKFGFLQAGFSDGNFILEKEVI